MTLSVCLCMRHHLCVVPLPGCGAGDPEVKPAAVHALLLSAECHLHMQPLPLMPSQQTSVSTEIPMPSANTSQLEQDRDMAVVKLLVIRTCQSLSFSSSLWPSCLQTYSTPASVCFTALTSSTIKVVHILQQVIVYIDVLFLPVLELLSLPALAQFCLGETSD